MARMLGGSIAHRVGEGFYLEQYGGARGILNDVLPEVGLWAESAPSPRRMRSSTRTRCNMWSASGGAHAPALSRYRHAALPIMQEPDRSATWPAREPGSFVQSEQRAGRREAARLLRRDLCREASRRRVLLFASARIRVSPFPGGSRNGGVLPRGAQRHAVSGRGPDRLLDAGGGHR